jgi:hypothetical protein
VSRGYGAEIPKKLVISTLDRGSRAIDRRRGADCRRASKYGEDAGP